jgi:hypothetical protein
MATWAVIVALTLVAGSKPSAEPAPVPDAKLIERLEGAPRQEEDKILDELVRRRQAVESALIRNLASPHARSRITAAYLLGMYRADAAPERLAKHITLEDEEALKHRFPAEPRWSRYPVAGALWKIGTPSMRFMVETIATSDDEKAVDLATGVVHGVVGPDGGRLILEREARKRTGIEADRLKKAAHTIEAWLPDNAR